MLCTGHVTEVQGASGVIIRILNFYITEIINILDNKL
jgi:hypothetical protein